MRSRVASRPRAGWVVVVLGVLATLCACTGDEPKTPAATTGRDELDPSGGVLTEQPEAEEEASAGPDADLSRKIQETLDAARFDEHEIGLTVSETYTRESGLDTPTAAYCGDDADPVDENRLARSQRWWVNEEWRTHEPGGYTVGVEVVLYMPGSAARAVAVLEAVPTTCPAAEFASGSRVTFRHGEVPEGLPGGSVALRDQWTYPNGTQAAGRIVAIPSGNVVGYLYVRGDEDAVAEWTDQLAIALAGRVAEADAVVRAGLELP